MKNLVSEIDQADRLGKLSKYITYEECLELPYLSVAPYMLPYNNVLMSTCSQAVMKEAMRMHPAVGFPLERYVPAEGAEICGHRLPAGTNVSVSAPVLHVNGDIFGEDAAKFRPERWLEAPPAKLKMMDRSFLAVSHGKRALGVQNAC